MLTKNFYIAQMAYTFRANINNQAKKPDGTVVSISATNSYTYPYLVYQSLSFRKDYNDMGVCVGSGNTPAAKTDYQMENLISSGLNQLSRTDALSFSEDGAEIVYAFILQNVSKEAITISEIGMICTAYTNSGSNSGANFLMDRTVLDAPVTIPAGESKTISYTIRFKYPA